MNMTSSEHKIVVVLIQFSDKKSLIPAAFFDQIFPWSFWSIDQLDRLFHICLEFCHVVPVHYWGGVGEGEFCQRWRIVRSNKQGDQ